jgi:hypothetical protein
VFLILKISAVEMYPTISLSYLFCIIIWLRLSTSATDVEENKRLNDPPID